MIYLLFATRSGKYVTEADVEARVKEMEATRAKMLSTLEYKAAASSVAAASPAKTAEQRSENHTTTKSHHLVAH